MGAAMAAVAMTATISERNFMFDKSNEISPRKYRRRRTKTCSRLNGEIVLMTFWRWLHLTLRNAVGESRSGNCSIHKHVRMMISYIYAFETQAILGEHHMLVTSIWLRSARHTEQAPITWPSRTTYENDIDVVPTRSRVGTNDSDSGISSTRKPTCCNRVIGQSAATAAGLIDVALLNTRPCGGCERQPLRGIHTSTHGTPREAKRTLTILKQHKCNQNFSHDSNLSASNTNGNGGVCNRRGISKSSKGQSLVLAALEIAYMGTDRVQCWKDYHARRSAAEHQTTTEKLIWPLRLQAAETWTRWTSQNKFELSMSEVGQCDSVGHRCIAQVKIPGTMKRILVQYLAYQQPPG